MIENGKFEATTRTASGSIGFTGWVLLILFLAMPGPVFAQESRASIIGQVSDASGAPVPGATVTAVEHNTHTTYTTKSNTAGIYSIPFIAPGQFTVTIEAQGFSQKVYPNVTLNVAQKLNLNVTLSVGSVRQRVTVIAAPGLVDTANASTGGIVDQTRLEVYPSEDRNPWDSLGWIQGIENHTTTAGIDTLRNDGGTVYSVNGALRTENMFFLEGTPVSIGNSWDFSASQEAVQELQASVGSYDAEYGLASGGSFNQVIKQGTNSFHGEAYDYTQYTGLTANGYANDLAGLPETVNNLDIFGGNVGGPIQKNKTFFFASYEGLRQDQILGATDDSVPTMAMRNGDFAETGYAIYNPSTVTCTTETSSGCSTYGRTEFPNDTIPQSDISPIGAAIINNYPLPTNSGLLDNDILSPPRTLGYEEYIGELDHDFSDKTRLSAIFTRFTSNILNFTNAYSTVAGNNSYIGGPNDINAILDFTRTISPSLVVNFKGSVSRWTELTTVGTALAQNYSIPGLSMPVVPTTPKQNIAPEIAVTNYTSLFGNTSSTTVRNYGYLTPSIDQVKGRHTLHYGFEFMDVQTGAAGIPSTSPTSTTTCAPNGMFTFNANWTQENPLTATTGTGNGLASLLLGYPSSGSVYWGINQFITYHHYGTYIQDDFKVLKNLTLNLGLRWDVDTSPSARHNNLNGSFCFTCTNPYSALVSPANYAGLENPLTGGLTFAGVTAPAAPDNVKFDDLGPRFGLAWAITPKTVFRGGFGIFYNYGNNATTDTGFSESTSYIDSVAVGSEAAGFVPTNFFLSGKPFPNGAIAPAGAGGGLQTDAGNGITYDSASGIGAVPWTQHWSAGLQRGLPKQILLDVEYVGSHSFAISLSQPWGVISPALQASCFANNATCNDTVPNPFYGILPAATSLGAAKTVDAWQLSRYEPLFNGISESNDPIGYQIYNSLEVRAERDIKSVDFVFNYQYANLMESDAYQSSGDFRSPSVWYGVANLDVRHFLNGDVVWPLPVGQGGQFLPNAHGLLGGLVSHWEVDANPEYWTGEPLEPTNANLVGGPGCTSYEPVGGQTAQHWFNNNVNCYKTLNQWQLATAPLYLGYLRIPYQFSLSAALQKAFALPREGMFLTFRMEASNALNHPTFGAPNTTLSDLPSFTPNVGYTGFGALPTTPNNTARYVILSGKLTF
jgi:hypothetical protein